MVTQRIANPLHVGSNPILTSAENKAISDRQAARKNSAAPAAAPNDERGGSNVSEPSIAELEKAIVEATLQGRGAVAEVLAERLRARLASTGSTVNELAKRRRPK